MPAEEGSPIVARYNYATGEFMRPNYYGEQTARKTNFSGLDTQINNRNTRMNRKGYAPVPNYMIGTGNSPMSAGGNNLMPSPQKGFKYLTSGGYPPPSAMPQNANVFPAMYNHQTGQRVDPQKFSAGLVPYNPKMHVDKHSSAMVIDHHDFSQPSYLGGTKQYRDVDASGGYRYRIFEDDSIQILSSPRGGSGTFVPKGGEAWVSIINEIGSYKNPKSFREVMQSASQNEQIKEGLSTIFDTFLQGKKTEEEALKLEQERLRQEQQAITAKTPLQKATPYLIGVGIIVGVGTIIAIATK